MYIADNIYTLLRTSLISKIQGHLRCYIKYYLTLKTISYLTLSLTYIYRHFRKSYECVEGETLIA